MEPTSTSITQLIENIEQSMLLLTHMAEDTDVSAMLTDSELYLIKDLAAILDAHKDNTP